MEAVQTAVPVLGSEQRVVNHKGFIGQVAVVVAEVGMITVLTQQAVRGAVVEVPTQIPPERVIPEVPQTQQPLTAYPCLRGARTLLV
jgi:hypothetical protein